MLSKKQIADSELCEKLSESGEDMDCLGCSCSVCIAHYSINDDPKIKDLRKLLEEAIEEIKNCYGKDTELTIKIRKELNK